MLQRHNKLLLLRQQRQHLQPQLMQHRRARNTMAPLHVHLWLVPSTVPARRTLKNLLTVGQTVKKGDVLCIVEAMKMMNHIEAEVGGVIESILVDNGQAVEYDQPLFTIV